MQTSRKITNLQAWQMAMDFAVTICKEILPQLPKNEQFALADQMRRSAQSIPANIAEGFGRHHYQETLRFCYIARGSLVEIYSHLTFAHRMGYLSDDIYEPLISQLQDLHKTLNSYITFLKRSKQGSPDQSHSVNEPSPEYFIEGIEEPDDLIF